jgi:hypothetical protein
MKPEMSSIQKAVSTKRLFIKCHKLPSFAVNSLDSVKSEFQQVTPISAQQAWREKLETHFAPMFIRVGWRDSALLVFAELTDMDIFTHATADNQRLWELGDVFEIFLRSTTQESYVELQIASNNKRLQLRYPNARAVALARKLGTADHLVIHGKACLSSTWVCADDQKWFVFAKIPVKTVCEKANLLPYVEWLFSFSRYDYTRNGSDPVISSTSPHTKADFHRQTEWGIIRFED